MLLEDIEISVRLYNQLKSKGINQIEDMSNYSADDVMKWRNIGRRCLEELLQAMKQYDVKFLE